MADLGANRMLCWWLERFALIYFVLCFPDGSLGSISRPFVPADLLILPSSAGPLSNFSKSPDQLGGDCRA
ncbi:hypothetical protein, partial [Sutterella wadsworthensis]|uniref:hypothetical protein n=1 Tax=Sutterella wadsworthensis TaxID=40545 RepID=UPI003966D594